MEHYSCDRREVSITLKLDVIPEKGIRIIYVGNNSCNGLERVSP